MSTVVAIMDGSGWAGNTDVIVTVDPTSKVLRWIPRDLWCTRLRDRVNAAFRIGGHECLKAALLEHGIEVANSLCLQRDAVERALDGVAVTVPVRAELDFWYPLAPREPLEEGRKRISFRPPSERLSDERIHQWIGARYSVRKDTTDLDRLQRQQDLLISLLASGFRFETALADPALVSGSSEHALDDLQGVDGTWRFQTLEDVIPARIDGKLVLLVRGRPSQLERPFPILMYHFVGEPPTDWPWPGLYVTREELAGHLDELERRGYVAVTQRDLHDGWNAIRELPDKPIVVNFDDGHESVWREAVPLMRGKGWPAVLNLSIHMLDREGGLRSEMVETLLDAGWELAAHSRTHPDLTKIPLAQLDDEVAGSRRALVTRFGAAVDFFCYPSGEFSEEVIAAVKRAGYLGATTTIEGLASPAELYTMRRVRISRGEHPVEVAERLARLEAEWQAEPAATPA